MTNDYHVNMQDSAGKTFPLYVNGACVDEQIATGCCAEHARECVEANQFQNAIARGDIGPDALVTA